MDLGKHVVDKEVLDCDGRRAGKVDDLILELDPPAPDAPARTPEVVAIVTGPLAMSRNLPRPALWLARQFHRLLGVSNPRPVEIPWSAVMAIDVVVHTNIHRDESGLTALAGAVARRFIERLPGA